MPSYAAVLRDIADSHMALVAPGEAFDPAINEAATLLSLATLLERVTPAMRHEVATLAGPLPRQAAMRGLRDMLIALAAGPQGETAT